METALDKAKVFWSGRSQAVRLPKKFRFETTEVNIWKEGRRVILEPKNEPEEDQWAWLDRMPGELDQDFLEAIEEDPGPPQERPELDELFK